MPLSTETREYPVAVESHAGRLFYGARNRVYFSQLFIDNLDSLAKCFQKNDPTSSEIPDLLPDDGGDILIQGAGSILALKEFWRGILAFTDRGIWYISGGDQGFSAVSYRVDQISTLRILAQNSVIRFEGAVYFVADVGICAVNVNENGNVVVDNLTELSINTKFQEFIRESDDPYELRAGEFITSTVNVERKEVHFLNPSLREELIFNIRVQAWYPQKYSQSEGGATHLYVPVIGKVQVRSFEDQGVPYIQCSTPTSLTFTDIGEAYDSFLLTQPENLGSFANKKSAPNVVLFFKKTEENITGFNGSTYEYDYPSSCTLTVQFDLDKDSSGNNFTKPKQVYRPLRPNYIASNIPEPFDTSRTVVTFRDIVRGSGTAIQYRLDSSEGKDMQVLGISTEYSMRGRQ